MKIIENQITIMSNISYYNEIIAKICKTLKTLGWPNYPG